VSHPAVLMVAKLKATAGVTALTSTRIWPDFRQSETLPAVVYEVDSDRPVNSAGGTTGTSEIAIAVTVYAATRTAARALSAAVRTALSGWVDSAGSVWHLDYEADVPYSEFVPEGQSVPTVSAIEQHYILHYA
jgi:hypothetical protein